jgi:FtsP/CotA-like multicopper oxidase with cupredoxin domain
MSISRRQFLIGAASAGVGAAASAAGLRALEPGRRQAASGPIPSRAGAAARTILLEARETRWELAPGRTVQAMTYDGTVPGPEIRAREGERLRIVFTNRLTEPTTIHWHGVDVPNAMDGVPGLTQEPVEPGGTFVYEFEAHPAGTRWYHTHFASVRQLDLGLAAPLIIEPAGGERRAADREHTLVFDDWETGAGPEVPDTTAGVAGARGEAGGMMRGGMGGMMRGMGGMMGRGMMGGRGRPAYDTMTINGKAYPATEPLRVRKGERVRLRLINASAEHTHAIRLAGHRLRVTHADGNAMPEPVEVDVVPIAPAERYDVLVEATHPGAWFLYCAQPGHVKAGERLLVQYDGHGRAKPEPPAPLDGGARIWRYEMGRGRDAARPSPDRAHDVDLRLGGGMMGSDSWTINGGQYPDVDPLRLERRERVHVRFRNRTMEAHPMHLHGQSFRVLAVNGRRLPAPLVKDTVDVEAHMGSVDVAFAADNPGRWLLHCHKPMHMEGGMAVLVEIA